jgi:hypothetical protein
VGDELRRRVPLVARAAHHLGNPRSVGHMGGIAIVPRRSGTGGKAQETAQF